MESSNNELNGSTSLALDHDKPTSSAASDKIPVSDSSVSKPDPSGSGSVQEVTSTKAPPIQEITEYSPSAYRIPPSVFERNPSSTPMDWSVTSNESLFSIHMGNMSFTNDQYLFRSGELGPPPEASTSDQIFSYPSHGSVGGSADMRIRELGLAEATMLEVIKESEGREKEKNLSEVRNARHSEDSTASNTSFAFSVMRGDRERMPSSVRSHEEHAPLQPQPDPKTPTQAGNGAQSSWFSCFSCCA